MEDAFNPQVVQWIYKIGPHYVGSLQAPQLSAQSEALCSLVNEERIVFGLNASATSPLTLAKIRKVYRKTDSRSVAKQLGMSSHENATPIRLLHNAAGHLSGPARTLGGVVIGYLGVRVFCPRPVCTTILSVGGCNVLLGLVAMATDVESLYASVKALVYVVKCNGQAQQEMERTRGYQTLAFLLKRHKTWLNNHVLQLVLLLAGFDKAGDYVPGNSSAFRDLLADLDVWRETADDLLKVLFDLFYRMAADGGPDGRSNTRYLRDLNLVGRLLHILQESGQQLGSSTRETMWNVLGWLLHNNPRPVDLLLSVSFFLFLLAGQLIFHFIFYRFGQYLAATLPVSISDGEETGTKLLDDSSPLVSSRNDGLALLSKLLLVHDKGVNQLQVARLYFSVLIPSKFPARLGSLRNFCESSDSIGSSSFYSRRSNRRPSFWPPTVSSSSFPCPTCWPDSVKASQRPAPMDGPDPRTSSSSWLPSNSSNNNNNSKVTRPAPVLDRYVSSDGHLASHRLRLKKWSPHPQLAEINSNRRAVANCPVSSSSDGSSSTTRPFRKSSTSSSD